MPPILPRLAACLAVLTVSAAHAETPPPVIAGKALFEENCIACHGPTASHGRSGDIRGSDYYRVRNATGGIERMPEIDVTDDEIRAIVAYLAHLKTAQ